METEADTMAIMAGAIGAAAGGAITLGTVPQIDGTNVYWLAIGGTLSLLGALFALLSLYFR